MTKKPPEKDNQHNEKLPNPEDVINRMLNTPPPVKEKKTGKQKKKPAK